MDEPLFSVRSLTKVFPNGSAALRGIDLDICQGECLLIAGSNGSGKTLFTRIIIGLLEPSGGTVLFRGSNLGGRTGNKTLDEIRISVGMVFQDADAQLLGETVEEDISMGPENLKLPRDEVKRRTEEALEALGLMDKLDYPPRRLSGGEKRRLAVAGVLAMGCGVVILDEPFANLDWPGVVQVLTIVRDLKAHGKTLIILTHELEKVLAFADRLVILDQGEIRCDGAPEFVLDRLDPCWGVRDPRRHYTRASDCTWL